MPRDPSTPARRRRRLVALAAVAAAVGAAWAAGARRPGRADPPDPCFASEPDRCFVARGAGVILAPGAGWDRAAVERFIDGALAYWSAPPGALEGWLLTFEDREVECNGARASGCTSWRTGTLRLQVLDPGCPETAQLVHELGHVILRDPGHRGRAWCRDAEQEATRALVRSRDASPACARSRSYGAVRATAARCGGPERPPR